MGMQVSSWVNSLRQKGKTRRLKGLKFRLSVLKLFQVDKGGILAPLVDARGGVFVVALRVK